MKSLDSQEKMALRDNPPDDEWLYQIRLLRQALSESSKRAAVNFTFWFVVLLFTFLLTTLVLGVIS
jgi:hypothetical protein